MFKNKLQKEYLNILERQEQEPGRDGVKKHAESLKLRNGYRILFPGLGGWGQSQKPRHAHRYEHRIENDV